MSDVNIKYNGMQFKKASKKALKLRLALEGVSGAGKTFSALAIAKGLGSKVAVIDTEHGSASLYADQFDFDVVELESFQPDNYIRAIRSAEMAGYDVVIIDSLSHAWVGKGGALELVDNAAIKSGSKNTFAAWREVTPQHNALVEAIIRSKCHVIATMRSKMEYALEKDERGKMSPRKIGLAPIQREGISYEFTIVGEMDLDHNLIITKSRCAAVASKVFKCPGEDFAKTLRDWLEQGAPEQSPNPSASTLPEPPVQAPSEPAPSSPTHTPSPSQADFSVDGFRARIRAAQSQSELDEIGTLVRQHVPDDQRMPLKVEFALAKKRVAPTVHGSVQ